MEPIIDYSMPEEAADDNAPLDVDLLADENFKLQHNEAETGEAVVDLRPISRRGARIAPAANDYRWRPRRQ